MSRTNSDLDAANYLNPDDEQDACAYCDAMPDQPHKAGCVESEAVVEANDIRFCDSCQCSYTTNCLCGLAERF